MGTDEVRQNTNDAVEKNENTATVLSQQNTAAIPAKPNSSHVNNIPSNNAPQKKGI